MFRRGWLFGRIGFFILPTDLEAEESTLQIVRYPWRELNLQMTVTCVFFLLLDELILEIYTGGILIDEGLIVCMMADRFSEIVEDRTRSPLVGLVRQDG